MPQALIPVNIRPHLVPFLFLEFQGVEATYYNKRVKAVKISTRNMLGKLIRILVAKADLPKSTHKKDAIFLSIKEEQRKTEYFGKIYRYVDGRNSFLYLPEEGVTLINEHLEGVFRSALLFYLDGWVESNGSDTIAQGIKNFLEKYDLENHGFEINALRTNYYRWKKSSKRLHFLVNQASNRVHNFS